MFFLFLLIIVIIVAFTIITLPIILMIVITGISIIIPPVFFSRSPCYVQYVFTSPLNFLLLNLTRRGRYRTVSGYHFVQIFDPGFCHLVSGPPLVPEFCICFASLLPSSPDHSVGVWKANHNHYKLDGFKA